jgi:hypothetical protein
VIGLGGELGHVLLERLRAVLAAEVDLAALVSDGLVFLGGSARNDALLIELLGFFGSDETSDN